MSIESASTEKWESLDLANPAQLEEALTVSRQASSEVGLGGRAFSIDWRLGSTRDSASLRVFVLRRHGAAVGFAVFSRRERPLKFLLGEVSLAEVKLTRYWHLGEPYVSPTLGPEGVADACTALVKMALASLASRECLFFEGLPADGPLHTALTADGRRPDSVRIDLGAEFEHQFIRMPASFADYLTELGSRSRQSLLYSQRRLLKDMGGDVRCECFESERSVDLFVADATAVSRKTYQWNLLGLGLRDSDALRASLTFYARQGWLRSFILYCKQMPVAFMLGSQHGNCYYYDDVGYDVALAKASVGSVLQLQVLEYLLSRADKPQYFDFSTGYGEHKGRFGNLSRREVNWLLMPATIRNWTLAGAYRGIDRLSSFAVGVLARAGVKERLKRMIRRRSVQKGEQK